MFDNAMIKNYLCTFAIQKSVEMSVEIKEVTSKKELKQFVKFNIDLYAGNPYHVHPPYRRGSRGHELVVMSWLGLIAQPLYDSFARYLQQRVMHRAYT